MPTVPEAIVLMLATVRIGAIHSVVFAGFGAQALGDRIAASGSRVVFAADVTYRKGKDVPLQADRRRGLQAAADRQWSASSSCERRRAALPTRGSRSVVGASFCVAARATTRRRAEMEANEPAFILATSGTTAKPKLAIHTHGGYQVYIATHGQVVLRPEARPMCGGRRPTSAGSSATATWSTRRCSPAARRSSFEGALDYPHAGRELAHGGRGVRRHRHLHVADGGPHADAIRRRAAARIDHSRLERVVCAGEVLNAAGVGLAAEHDSRWPRAGDRSHVADRDRRSGVRQSVRPRHAADQARVGGDSAAGHRRGGRDARRASRARRAKRASWC